MEDVDREPAALPHVRKALALVIDTDEHQRRIERDRGKRAGGEASRTLLCITRGDDRDTGGEVAADMAKIVWADHRSYIASGSGECKISRSRYDGSGPWQIRPRLGEGV